jgi:hypothetical protein
VFSYDGATGACPYTNTATFAKCIIYPTYILSVVERDGGKRTEGFANLAARAYFFVD